jgi:hypothetical protein
MLPGALMFVALGVRRIISPTAPRFLVAITAVALLVDVYVAAATQAFEQSYNLKPL